MDSHRYQRDVTTRQGTKRALVSASHVLPPRLSLATHIPELPVSGSGHRSLPLARTTGREVVAVIVETVVRILRIVKHLPSGGNKLNPPTSDPELLILFTANVDGWEKVASNGYHRCQRSVKGLAYLLFNLPRRLVITY